MQWKPCGQANFRFEWKIRSYIFSTFLTSWACKRVTQNYKSRKRQICAPFLFQKNLDRKQEKSRRRLKYTNSILLWLIICVLFQELFLGKIFFFNLRVKFLDNQCRFFRNLTSNSIKPWYQCSRDGERDEILKKIYNSKINQREIQFRRWWGSSEEYMPNSINFTVQLRGVSRSSWLLV